MKNVPGYTLFDGKVRNQEAPDTFEIPEQAEIDKLQIGDHVKLGFSEPSIAPERMWVKIISIDGDDFQGFLDNDPFSMQAVKLGDIVKFNSKHILSTL